MGSVIGKERGSCSEKTPRSAPRSEKKKVAKEKTVLAKRAGRKTQRLKAREKRIVSNVDAVESVPESVRSNFIALKKQNQRWRMSAFNWFLENQGDAPKLSICFHLAYDAIMSDIERRSVRDQVEQTLTSVKNRFFAVYDQEAEGRILNWDKECYLIPALEVFEAVRGSAAARMVPVKLSTVATATGEGTTSDLIQKCPNKSLRIVDNRTGELDEVFAAEDIILLSPEATETLTELEVRSGRTFVIGALADRTVKLNQSRDYAERRGLKTNLRRLPLEDVTLSDSCPLNINTVFDILLDTMQGKTLKDSIKFQVPRRKKKDST